MRVTPRGTEVKAIAELLDSGDFDSAEAMAKAVIKRVAELLSERDMYAWVYRESPEAFYLPFGPFTSDSEARKFAGKYVGMLKGQHMILPLYSTAGLTERMNAYKIPSAFCVTCNHSHISHQHPNKNGRCAVRGCKCRKDATE